MDASLVLTAASRRDLYGLMPMQFQTVPNLDSEAMRERQTGSERDRCNGHASYYYVHVSVNPYLELMHREFPDLHTPW